MRVLVLVFAILFVPSISLPKPTKGPNGLSIDLIHRDSTLSPFYNSSITLSEYNKNAMLRSFSRANYFRMALKDEEPELGETVIHPSPASGEYIMRFYIGTPPVERYGLADTGSDLIWVQCKPCENCYPQDAPKFNPKKSSTFKVVSCHSKPCSFLPPSGQSTCGKSKECSYIYEYQDMSYTKGELAMEFINLTPSEDDQTVSFPKLVFGCGHNNTGNSRDTAGIVGLGGGPLSLVSQLRSQLGNKFSYCLLPPSSNSASKLKFGDDAVMSDHNGVVSTPLFSKPSSTAYILNLEGITVGVGKKTTVKTNQTGRKGNTIIDSGAIFTFLPSSLYNQFVGLIKVAIGVDAVQNPPESYNLCYRSGTKLPDSVFHFTNADIVLKPANLFRRTNKKIICLAVFPIEGVIGVYGNMAQINFEVEYDLDKRMVSFAPADCTK